MQRPPKIWCYKCKKQFPHPDEGFTCPECHSGFIEKTREMINPPIEYDIPLIATPCAFQQGNQQQYAMSIEFNVGNENLMGSLLSLHLLQSLGRNRGQGNGNGDNNARQQAATEFMNLLSNPLFETMFNNMNNNNNIINNNNNNNTNNTRNNNLNLGDYFLGNEDQLLALAEQLSRMDPQHLGSPPLDPAKIENLPVQPFDQDECKDVACTICREELKKGEEVVVLQCGHPFHLECLQPWLRIHSECPSCRESILN